MELGTVLKDCRELRDMSQAELAFRTGMTVTIINQVELGQITPSPQTGELGKICEALDIPESVVLMFLANDLGLLGDAVGDALAKRLESLAVELILGSTDETEDDQS